MKTIIFSLTFLFVFSNITAQGFVPMGEDAIESESLSATYEARFVKNRKTQDVYDIKVSIKNNGHDLIMLKRDIGQVEFSLKPYTLAEFRFDNATGSNFTDKDGFVVGREIHKDISFNCKKCGSEEDETELKSDRFLVGYGIKRGDISDASFRVRVPKGEEPMVKIRFLNN